MPDRRYPLETLLAALSGWLPLLAGMSLLAMTLITPTWMGWRELVWQRDMLRLQAQGLAQQKQSYVQFHDALSADDPVLLERLAFTHLRYKPVGKHLLDSPVTDDPGPAVTVRWSGDHAYAPADRSQMIEGWLAAPQPVVGKDIAPLRPINSKLTRLTAGSNAVVLIAVALLCLIAGLWPDGATPPPNKQANPGGDPGGYPGGDRFTASRVRIPLRPGRRFFPTSRTRP